MISESILCLSLAIFHESRGESKKAQYAVAEVIHNRTKHPDYPDSYCAVIKQKGQFSFVKNHKSHRIYIISPTQTQNTHVTQQLIFALSQKPDLLRCF